MNIQDRFAKKKIILAVASAVSLMSAASAQAQSEDASHLEDELQEIVITAPFEASEAQTALPIGILSGEALREKVMNSLGDTLKNEIGMANASFGTGVGQPIIRGQTGNRVSVLQNGISLTDASNVSPDHANGAEAILADRIEVIRGPSTLLYGSGAVGGVVNVIDNRIPSQLVDRPEFFIQQTNNSVNDENKTIVRFDASVGSFGFHVDAFTRDNDNVEIDGFAIDEAAVEAIEELAESMHLEDDDHDEDGHDEEGHDEEGHEEGEEEFENTRGFIGNSNGEGEGFTIGSSYVGEKGFFGFSISEIENDYGLPPGTHAHGHEEEHHDEEEHEEGEEEHDEEEHEEEEVEFVRIALEQTRYDFKGEYSFDGGFFESLKANIGYTDYEHREIEFFEDGEVEVGTLFSNEGTEARFEFKRAQTGNWEGVWGLQLSDTEFSATGEEAFIPKTEISNLGLFGVERYTNDRITAEIGFRFDDNQVDPVGSCSSDETATSVSGSVLYDIDSESNFLVAAARSERTPSVEELYSNISLGSCAQAAEEDLVLHAATSLFEVGNTSLDKEVSNNIEFGYRRHSGAWTGEFSAYYNQIDDYIFLNIGGETIDEQFIADYQARDATFSGVEAELSLSIYENNGVSGELSVFGDVVNASFDSGGDVPRVPPSKMGAELRYFSDNWSAHLHVSRFGDQDDVGPLEFETDGYVLVSLYADYHVPVAGDSEFKLFARADNLLDEEVRNHASFLKNFSPEPGRGMTLGLRFEY